MPLTAVKKTLGVLVLPKLAIDFWIFIVVREDDGGSAHRSCKAAAPGLVTPALDGGIRGKMGF